uniref:Hexosyltransferase n=1 Tax=Clytia hemisphaerica TaxID=252671 RepID=A0A7M5VGX1_9CNID
MRRFCFKTRSCCSLSSWIVQVCINFTLCAFMYIFMQVRLAQQQNSFAAHLAKRNTIDHQTYTSWQCDMNRRMLKELQKQMTEKNKLLNYRGKVIMNLRKTVDYLNSTKIRYDKTLFNLSRELSSTTPIGNISEKTSNDQNHDIPLDDLRTSASRASRPCCMALNRMTDILRGYMETTQELRETVADLRRNRAEDRATTTTVKPELRNRKAFNHTWRPEKYSVYQLYTGNSFYESIPLNRLEPKQKVNTKTFRRNFDFQYAARSAQKDIIAKYRYDPKFLRIKDSIFRYDELYGAKYTFTFVYNSTFQITSNVVKPYSEYKTEKLSVTDANVKKELINLIVSVSQRSDRLILFLRNIHEIRKRRTENIFVTIVIHDTGESSNGIKKAIKEFSKSHNFTAYDILKKNVPFNRGHALHDGIMRWNGYAKVLMFLCDIDIRIKPDFFDRCRKYTEAGRSVYMPIVFSLYNPNIVFNGNLSMVNTEKTFEINEQTGTWRPYGYGMTCFYKTDYMRTGGFNLRIHGWGREDYNLYVRMLKKGLNVVRAPDPSLLHIWHSKTCSPSLNKIQYNNCLGSKARYEGSQRQLGILLFKSEKQKTF